MGSLAVPVLVLNNNWVPIRVTTAMDALRKMFEGKAKAIVVDDYSQYDFDSWAELKVVKDNPYIVTARSEIKIPEVILLKKYGKMPERKVVCSRANIFRRDKYTCQYCGKQATGEELTIDHVLPRSRGGTTEWTNCVVACIGCNRKKANKLPSEVGMKLRNKPFKPNWSPRLVLQKVKNTPEAWEKFVSDAYWNTELK
jgi:5-methylcytosine-specific restriction endonuclease McrA